MNPHNTPARLTEANFSVLDPGDGNTIPYQKWNQSCSLTVAGTETRVIPAPTKEGQRQTIFCAVNAGADTCTVTVADSSYFTGANDASLTFNAVDDLVVLESVHVGSDVYEWRVTASEGTPATLYPESVFYADTVITTNIAGGISGGDVTIDDATIEEGRIYETSAVAAKTTTAGIEAANMLGGLITVTHAAGANQNYQLPTGAELEAAGTFTTGQGFEWSIINLSGTPATNTATITVDTGHTIVGEAVVGTATVGTNSARFFTRKSGASTYVTYRIG